jgi:hypothetical protein
MCAGHSNQWREAVALMREALRIGQEANSTHPSVAAAGLNLADSLVLTDPWAAVEVARGSLADARRIGSEFLLPVALTNLMQALLLTGGWDEAAAEVDKERHRDRLTQEFAYCIVLFDSIRGHLDGLDELVAQLAEGADTEDEQVRRLALMTLAAHAAAAGDHVSALAGAREALDANTLPCSHEMVRWAWSIACEAAFALDKVEEVERLLAWLDAYPIGYLANVQVVERHRVAAKLLAHRGDSAAGAALDDAVTALRELGSPYHLAVGLLDAAEHYARVGEGERAFALAAEAREIGERLGCVPVQTRAAGPAGTPSVSLVSESAPVAGG